MNNITIGKQIKYYRNRAGMRLIDVGEKIGVSKQCLSGWEHGRNMPDAIALYKLSKIFNIEMEAFFEEETNDRLDSAENTSSIDLNLTPDEVMLIHRIRSMDCKHQNVMELLLEIV